MIELEEWKQNALFIFASVLLIALLRHGYLPTPRASGCMISHQCGYAEPGGEEGGVKGKLLAVLAAGGAGGWECHVARVRGKLAYPGLRWMLRCLYIALLTFSVAVFPLPLRAQERAPSESEIVEFNKNFLGAMDKFLGDKEVSEFLGVLSVVSLAHYNCKLIEAGIVKPDAVDELLSQYYLSVYDAPNRDMSIHMQSSVLSDYIIFSKDVVSLCDPKRILPRFKGLPISAPK